MPLPRSLFVLALLWCLAAFLATIGVRAPIQPTSGAYVPAVRGLLALLALGIALLWPIGRLTAHRTDRWPPARVALDTFVVIVLLQGAFWPLHLVTHWSLERAAAADLLLSGWAAACGGMIAIGLGGANPNRWAAAALAIAAAGPLLGSLGARAPLPEAAGPFAALAAIASEDARPVMTGEWAIAAWPWSIAAASWAMALRLAPRTGAGCPPAGEPLP